MARTGTKTFSRPVFLSHVLNILASLLNDVRITITKRRFFLRCLWNRGSQRVYISCQYIDNPHLFFFLAPFVGYTESFQKHLKHVYAIGGFKLIFWYMCWVVSIHIIECYHDIFKYSLTSHITILRLYDNRQQYYKIRISEFMTTGDNT